MKTNKRALIISFNQAEKISGIEVYNSKLAEILVNNNFIVDEFSFIKSTDFTNSNLNNRFYDIEYSEFKNKSWFFQNFAYRKRLEKKVNQILSENNEYDLIINSTNCAIKSVMWNKNYIWVQHFDSNFIQYSNNFKNIRDKIKGYAFKLLLWFYNLKTPLLNSSNIVSPYNGYIPSKFLRSKINYFYILLFIDNNYFNDNEFNVNFDSKKKSKFLYLGRIQEGQKNLDYIIRNFGDQIDYYGPVIDKKILPRLKNNYKGVIKNRNDLALVFKTHSYLVLSSLYEGFSFAAVESLWNGTPIIMSNMIISNDFFFKNNNKIGYIININKDIDIKDFKKISAIDYKEMCVTCFDFARKTFDQNQFISEWNMLINRI